MATSKTRQATISFGKKGDGRVVRVSHPGRLSPEEIKRIDDVLVNKVIKELTGCSCLSGTHDVIWERDYERLLDVQLGG
jgi:hypothetical protein